MRGWLALVLLCVTGCAYAQVSMPYLKLGAGPGETAIVLNPGAIISLNGDGGTDTIQDVNGSPTFTGTFAFTSIAVGTGGVATTGTVSADAGTFNGPVGLPQGSSLWLNAPTNNVGLSYNGTGIVSTTVVESANGYGNNGSSASQGVQFSGSSTFINAASNGSTVLRDAAGNQFFSGSNTGLTVGTATTTKPISIAGGSGAFVGTCTMAAATTCTATVPTGAKCTSSPATAGTASCVGAPVVSTTVTITASASNSQTWNILCL